MKKNKSFKLKTETLNLTTTKQSIYINPQIISYFNQTEVIIKAPDSTIINNISELNNSILTLAVTDNPLEALQLKKEYACGICFINNHSNDYIDFMPTYEITSEEVPQKLQKLLTNHQN